MTTSSLAVAVLMSGCSMDPQPSAQGSAAAPVNIIRDKASCDALANTAVAGGKIESTSYLEAGQPTIERPPFSMKAPANFCRVTVTLSSGPGSAIRSEYWLPDSWNRKFYAVGGGGFNGGLDSSPLMLTDPLAQGYAGAASDAGHPTEEGARWAYNDPDTLADWANRANHITAVFGKALIGAYYEQAPQRSYFEGCSNGGRDALILAQQHPGDFDGIISGAPAADWTGLMSSFVSNLPTVRTFGTSGQDAKFSLISNAVLAKCDAVDGVKDGVIEQPRACTFDPAEIQCTAEKTAGCLSKAEADAMRTVYQGHTLPGGRKVFPGFSFGAEAERTGWRDMSATGISQMGVEFYRWMVYGDPDWDAEQFDLGRDYPVAVERMGPVINANNPDISDFTKRGGKLLLWHGWNDTLIPAEGTIDYYNAVKSTLGANTDTSVRLFMAPGVNHCFGGSGPSFFDKLTEIDQWVETGSPPNRIVATKYDNDMFRLIGMPAKPARTRPLCAWPQSAHYSGSGSTDDAANFTCKAD